LRQIHAFSSLDDFERKATIKKIKPKLKETLSKVEDFRDIEHLRKLERIKKERFL